MRYECPWCGANITRDAAAAVLYQCADGCGWDSTASPPKSVFAGDAHSPHAGEMSDTPLADSLPPIHVPRGGAAVSPAILDDDDDDDDVLVVPDDDPDPDTEIPMTTDLDTPTTTLTLERDAETIRARTPDEVRSLVRKASAGTITRNFVQKAKGGEGTGSLGLYIEMVVFSAAGKPFTHAKFFIVDRHIYSYNRSSGDARANWRHRAADSLEHALTVVQKAIDRSTVRIFGHPVLVELKADDISTIEAGGIPPARFRGEARITKDFGRYDFKMDISSSPLPASLTNMLRNPTIVTVK